MKEGLKRNIYHELATHDVKVEDIKNVNDFVIGRGYIFGQYRVEDYWDYIRISKFNPDNKHFVIMKDATWGDDYPYDTTYEICQATKNKFAGKPYVDPYKNMTKKQVIADSTKRFDDNMSENADNFLPYDMSKELRVKIITEMKQIFAQKIQEKCK